MKLVEVGFFHQQASNVLSHLKITGGDVQNCVDALSILKDTHKVCFKIVTEARHSFNLSQTLQTIISLVNSRPIYLTVDLICALYKSLMKSSQILPVENTSNIKYIATGTTRQATGVNVMTKRDKQISQFCPSKNVDAALVAFCTNFNVCDRNSTSAFICNLICDFAGTCYTRNRSVCTSCMDQPYFFMDSSVRSKSMPQFFQEHFITLRI